MVWPCYDPTFATGDEGVLISGFRWLHDGSLEQQ